MLKKLNKIRLNQSFVLVFRVFLGLGIGFTISQLQVHSLESMTYDWRARILPNPPTSGLVQLTTITQETLESLGHHPTANEHTQFLKNLAQGEPKTIIYTFDPTMITGSYQELQNFVDVAKNLGVILSRPEFPSEEGADLTPILPPLDQLRSMSGSKTADNFSFGKDKVSRRWIYSFQDQKLMHAQVVKEFYPELVPENENYQGLFPYKRTTQAFIEYRRKGFYPNLKFEDVLKGDFQPGTLEGKILLVGMDAKSSLANYVRTPFSSDILAMSLVEMHANIFDTVLLNRSPITPSTWFNIVFTCLISLLTVFVVLSVKPTWGLGIIITTFASLFAISLALLYLLQIRMQMAHPMLAMFVCYYFLIPYRLILENRKSWEYYQKNNLLTQVEELKTNFLKMMSHDLKTPLARIQGMTDVVLQDPKAKDLSEEQANALKTINRSSVELSEFIGSILSYGRIESKEIKLMLQSKDVNQVLEDVIKKTQFLAKEKNITIFTELEPLFSVKFDVDLMRQVFTNLIENAIKYSPENSKILVSTEEEDGKIIVQVADQGFGIPKDECERVFDKFYRSKNAVGSPTKGSGLGLYLANYFAQLHKGSIRVESEVGEGSTFYVELPSDLDMNTKPLGRS